jgi:hypothetical protein
VIIDPDAVPFRMEQQYKHSAYLKETKMKMVANIQAQPIRIWIKRKCNGLRREGPPVSRPICSSLSEA